MKLVLVIFAIFCITTGVSAFSTFISTQKGARCENTNLDMTTRRNILAAITTTGFVAVAAPSAVLAQKLNGLPADNEIIKGQNTIVGKTDINNSPVADYMRYPGMYPTIAGKISTNGPYKSVKDVYKVKLLTKEEKAKIKKYEKQLTVTPATGLDPLRGRDPYRKRFNE